MLFRVDSVSDTLPSVASSVYHCLDFAPIRRILNTPWHPCSDGLLYLNSKIELAFYQAYLTLTEPPYNSHVSS